MSENDILYKTLSDKAWKLGLSYPEVPTDIIKNLKFPFFEWQKEAFENLITFNNIKELENPISPTHLMFNMATGSGKTLLMAACILYYYKKGYNHFLFFVNQNNIVDKTENNFINSSHSKYLFTNNIVINDRTIKINKVETFSEHTDDIEIKFTTIQQLYNDIHIERENRVILEELNNKNLVMLADEAHHLNADTQRKSAQLELDLTTEITGVTGAAEIERKGWEHTVIELILNKQGRNSENVILEFTATIPDNIDVQKKYNDKIIYKYDLKDFLSAGHTKEINLISSGFNKKERILHALLFNWYRDRIALKYYKLGNNSLMNFKPIILFRSKTISESYNDYEYFLQIINNLETSDFSFLKDFESEIHESMDIYEQGRSRTKDILEFINKEQISYSQIVDFLKYNFSEKNCILTNSKTNKTQTEKTDDEQESLLNNLEDKNNNIRAIFTVKRLTEGWDVLNLFDIVRLYQGQNTGGSTTKTPKSTTEEKQLIGRGVRYYPFSYKNKITHKRKLDDNPQHELRILEELYFYTYDENSKYISHLKEELRRDGYINDNKVRKTFDLKDDFKKKPIFKNSVMWVNDKIINPSRQKQTLNDIKEKWYFKYHLPGLAYSEEEINLQKNIDTKRLDIQDVSNKTLKVSFKDFEKHILNKAINIKAKQDNSLLRFNNLKKELNIESINDLFNKEFLGDFKLNIIVPSNTSFNTITNLNKLKILLAFLEQFLVEFQSYINPHIGTSFRPMKMSEMFAEPKIKIVEEDKESLKISSKLKLQDWYVLNEFIGTSEERNLIEDIMGTISDLQSNYEEVYLLRNEEIYKIYDFETGQGFQPDFILLLQATDKEKLFYQVFIEPKGDGFLVNDNWKEKFLKIITKEYSDHTKNLLIHKKDKYVLIGLPLYNTASKHNFAFEYSKLWNQKNN